MKLPAYVLVYGPESVRATPERVSRLATAKTSALFGGIDVTSKKPSRTRSSRKESTPAIKPCTVGLWDLGAWLGEFGDVIEGMNSVQDAFRFFEVQAGIPVGLTKKSSYFEEFYVGVSRAKRKEMEAELANNVVANEVFEYAEPIREALGLDLIVGITPSMVALFDKDELFWNHFATFSGRTALASTYDLRRFAQVSGVPFEAYVAGIIIAEVLVAKFYPKLGFHEDRGCFFDYHGDRESIMKTAKDPKIEKSCMRSIEASYRPAVDALLELLRTLKARQP